MDTSPLFAISLWEDYSIDTIRKKPDTRIGYVHHDSLFHLFPESKSFIAKSLDQLVNLLLIKRVDVLVVTKKNLNQVLKNFPYQKFKTSLRPIYFENTYYFYHSKSKDKIATIKQAYDQLITTPYYQTLFENFSNQNSWQD